MGPGGGGTGRALEYCTVLGIRYILLRHNQNPSNSPTPPTPPQTITGDRFLSALRTEQDSGPHTLDSDATVRDLLTLPQTSRGHRDQRQCVPKKTQE